MTIPGTGVKNAMGDRMTEQEAIEELKYDCAQLGKSAPCDTSWGAGDKYGLWNGDFRIGETDSEESHKNPDKPKEILLCLPHMRESAG